MAEKSFVLLSLKDDKARNLSKALSNDSCRKILDYLASKGDATETQISKDLKVPISTVHYNMKLLADNGLVSMDEYHYSEKGKEVIHYKMRNRYIVIAPEPEDAKSVLSKLKGMLPAVLILGVGTFIIGLFEILFKGGESAAPILASRSAEIGIMAKDMAQETAMVATTAASSSAPIALWFFIGGLFGLIGVLMWSFTRK